MTISLRFFLDCEYLKQHKASSFSFVSYEKTLQIIDSAPRYKNYFSKLYATDYDLFKKNLRELKEVLLPFRMGIKIENVAPQLILEKQTTLRLLQKILWIHGTNSSICPGLARTDFTMLPTGRLFTQYGLAPMGGGNV